MSKLILITGATGFVGSEIALEALRQGHSIRIVVRKQSQADAFTQKYSEFSDRVQSAVVGDIAEAGALDEAMKGTDAVIHSASPATFSPEDIKRDILDPAINGTLAALRSAAKEPKIKAFALTTSIVSHLDPLNPPAVDGELTDKDVPSMSYEEACGLPKEAGVLAYCASKQLAEKAAWKFVEEEKPAFTLTTVAPTWVLGYNSEATLKTWKDLRSSFGITAEAIFDRKDFGEESVAHAYFVDVADVAKAHVGAITHHKEVAGQRFLLTGGRFSYAEAARLIAKAVPEFASHFPHTNGAPTAPAFKLDGSKASKAFGFKYTTLEESMAKYGRQLAALPVE